jgi:hypothetical protein
VLACALVMALLAPVCICYPIPASTGDSGCHGMPAAPDQNSSSPNCCTVQPPTPPRLAASIHHEAPFFLIAHVAMAGELSATDADCNPLPAVLSLSPPLGNAILRI